MEDMEVRMIWVAILVAPVASEVEVTCVDLEDPHLVVSTAHLVDSEGDVVVLEDREEAMEAVENSHLLLVAWTQILEALPNPHSPVVKKMMLENPNQLK
jgi:hypothetical protein